MGLENFEKEYCAICNGEIQDGDDFCPDCGSLLIENVACTNHPNTEAQGVCVICLEPFCSDCGLRVSGLFLCDPHSHYEIYEGMARIYGSSDSVDVEYRKKMLEDEGFHPYIYARKASAISLGGPDFTLFRASGEFDGHIVNEFKLMVPCQEALEAEKKLQEIT